MLSTATKVTTTRSAWPGRSRLTSEMLSSTSTAVEKRVVPSGP
jgi:hypothetical protein